MPARGGDRRREGTVLGMNLGCPVVTNGDFATRLFQITLARTLSCCIHSIHIFFHAAILPWGPKMRRRMYASAGSVHTSIHLRQPPWSFTPKTFGGK